MCVCVCVRVLRQHGTGKTTQTDSQSVSQHPEPCLSACSYSGAVADSNLL